MSAIMNTSRDQWIDAVHMHVRAQIGGEDKAPGGNERQYGGARFIHAADYKPGGDDGRMIFSVQRLDVVGNPTRQVHTGPWRTTDAANVAREIVAKYRAAGKA
jgi:hypothetical protein